MHALSKRDVNFFFGFLVFSLIGNACADYALLWYGLSLTSDAKKLSSDHTLSYFYVGQALGIMLLSPLLAVVFDRFRKLTTSIAIDSMYAVLLIAIAIIFSLTTFIPMWVFFFSMATAALATLHKGTVGFAAIQKMAEQSSVTDLVAKFFVALNLPFLLGSVLSGFVFHYVGFVGCMVIGIVTFIPMPFVYYRIFGSMPQPTSEARSNFFPELKEGLSVLFSDKLLWGTAVSIMVLNIASAVLPAIVGLSFLKKFPGRTDYASIAISVAILGGVMMTKYIGQRAKEWSLQWVVPMSLIPASCLLVVCFFYQNPFVVAAMFLLSCIGSAARNVSSGSLRVARVPKTMTGRVNTAYLALLNIGQTIGGIVIVQVVQQDFRTAIGAILACFIGASVLSVFLLPRAKLSTLLEVAK